MSESPYERLKTHNAKKVKSTRAFAPWQIVIIEECENRIAARIREKYWKSSGGRRRSQAILKNNETYPVELVDKK